MGFVLDNRFDRSKTKTMAQQAIEQYQACSGLIPASHFYQKKILRGIASVNEGVTIFRKAGKLKP